MALNKQKILNDLGNVMNQLQSADCGCMGKLFSDANQGQQPMSAMNSLSTCGGCSRGCCHGHGYGCSAPHAGEPYNNMNNASCMGHCNPPKLYADTYNYLSENLMRPVVNEVYQDLKSINPNNTIMNNPLGAQLGLSSQGNTKQPIIRGNMGNAMGNQNFTPAMGGNTMNYMDNGSVPQHQMGGMGPQIVNMMMGDGTKASNMSGQASQGLDNTMQAPQANAVGGNQGQYNTGMMNMSQGNSSMQMKSPATQYIPQSNVYTGTNVNAQINPGAGNMTQNITPGAQEKLSPAHQQMANRNFQSYGQHSQGIAKFNEMFPGVMQGLGGDLNFDPMTIAIQMNPENHQKVAMDTMHKLMNNNGSSSAMKPALLGAQPASASIAQPNTAMPPQVQQNVIPNQVQQNIAPTTQALNQQIPQQPVPQTQPQTAIPNASALVAQPQYMQQQQVYTAVTGASSIPQQQIPQQEIPAQGQYEPPQHYQPQQQYQPPQQYQSQYQQQQMIDPNIGAVIMQPNLPFENNAVTTPNTQMQSLPPPAQISPQMTMPTNQEITKEPIYPVDTSKNIHTYTRPQKYEYNTLGQPVEMLPVQMYQSPVSKLPQTLSPQLIPTKLRSDPMKYSNVKNTVSKTSIMGYKPGRIASKSQLQHIYNQYKGSQSYTQQNVKPAQFATHSLGRLDVSRVNMNPPQQIPLEKVGGDTIPSNQMANNQPIRKVEQVMDQIGDVLTENKPQDNVAPMKKEPARHTKCRNGLQDMVYTSYPTSTAWSFHGNSRTPLITDRRYRRY